MVIKIPSKQRGKESSQECALKPSSIDWSKIPEVCDLEDTDVFQLLDPTTGQLQKVNLTCLVGFLLTQGALVQ